MVWSMPRLDRVPTPEDALALVVSRTMDMEGALEGIPQWERLLFDTISGGGHELEQAISWYEELAEASSDPVVQLHLAILEGEADRTEQVTGRIEGWQAREAPFPVFRRFMEGAYLAAPLDPETQFQLQAELAEALPAGWFYDRLAIRLAQQGGDPTLLSVTRQAGASRANVLLQRAREFLVVELSIVLIGGTVLVVILVRRGDRQLLLVGRSRVPPPWRGRAGVVVLLRGGACGVLLMVAFLFGATFVPLSRLVALPLINLPLLVLAYKYLLQPAGLRFGEGFGLKPVSGSVTRILMAVPALVAAGEIMDWCLSLASVPLGFSMHWTEWFDPELAWGTWEGVGLSLVDYVLYAPVLEELAFRGILFATLRRRFGFSSSAALSALIFAMAHGYGLLGFLSVWWSGVIWAWGYERTGSLLPGMIAHSLNNLLVSTSLLVFLR